MYVPARSVITILKELTKSVSTLVGVYLFLYIAKIILYALVTVPVLGLVAVCRGELGRTELLVWVSAVAALFIGRGAWRGFDL